MGTKKETVNENQTSIPVETVKKEETKKKQAVSVSYTLQSLASNILKLKEAGLLTEKEVETLTTIKNEAVNKYVQNKFK